MLEWMASNNPTSWVLQGRPRVVIICPVCLMPGSWRDQANWRAQTTNPNNIRIRETCASDPAYTDRMQATLRNPVAIMRFRCDGRAVSCVATSRRSSLVGDLLADMPPRQRARPRLRGSSSWRSSSMFGATNSFPGVLPLAAVNCTTACIAATYATL